MKRIALSRPYGNLPLGMMKNVFPSTSAQIPADAGFCPICRCASPPEIVVAKEMVWGTREKFHYGICPDCGVAWLMDPPEDIGHYYKDYYSLDGKPSQMAARIFRMLRNGLFGQFFGNATRRICQPFYNFAARAIAKNDLAAFESSYDSGFSLNVCSLFGLGLGTDSRVLDYGSGTGEFVLDLSQIGFKNVLGVDPFLKEDIVFVTGAKVVRGDLAELKASSQTFDLITLHHAFEHIPNPFEVAAELRALMHPKSVLLLRFPNVGSPHFMRYRGNWLGLHAPRHYFLHSRKSLELVFNPVGMEIYHVKCDSEYDHYLYSQEYELDIPDNSPFSFRAGHSGIFTGGELRYWKAKAKRFNRALVGDWIVYYLRLSTSSNS